MKKKHILLLTLIIAIGIFFRFYMIKEMPAGLFPDEAAEGLDAQNILKGFYHPFYDRGNGREGLFYYLLAPIIKFVGEGYWQPHLVSAGIGVLTVIAIYLLAKRLYDEKTALISAYLAAVGTWAIVLSRTAFRANLLPLFLALTTYFIVRVVQAQTTRERFWSAIFAGTFLAGGFYSYIAYRIIILLFAFIALILVIADRKQKFEWVKKYWISAIIAAISFIVVFAPLGFYFLTHPGSFVGRSSQVSIFNPNLNHGNLGATLIDVTRRSMQAFFTSGDLNWRHNISGQSFLSPLLSPFFAIALIWTSLLTLRFIFRAFKGKVTNSDIPSMVIAGLFWGMLVPVITTAEGIPHGLRSIGMLPATYILSALGLVYFGRWANKLWHYRWMEKLYWLVAILYLATIGFTAYTQYFVYAKNSSENYYAFRGDLSVVSDYLNANPDKEHNYLVLDLFSEQTVQYLTAKTNHPYIIVDPENSYKLYVQPGDKVIFTHTTLFDTQKFNQYHKNMKIVEYKNNSIGDTDMIVYTPRDTESSSSLSFNSDHSFWALNMGDKIYFSWENQSLTPWVIKISKCVDSYCDEVTPVKEDNQNDYFANTDWIDLDATQSDLYYKAAGYDKSGKLIKDFGIIKVNQYK